MLGHRLLAFSRRAMRVARRRNPPNRWVSRLLNSGLFDRDFYEAQTGLRFEDDELAVRHFLSASPAHAYTLHPLVEPGWIERQTGDSALPWHAQLFRADAIDSTGPLFDLGVMRERAGAAASATPAQLLGSFVSGASAVLLPGATDDGARSPAWPDARVPLRRLAEATSRQMASAARRNSTEWDAAAEQRLLASLGPVAVPAAAAPLVSVIMPTYNRASLIGAAIESVCAQSVSSWELIVVDDGSSDGTAGRLAGLQREDDRIRLVSQDNAGVSAARNNGIAHATGAFVAFLDSDNTWTPDFLRASLASLQAANTPGSFAAVEIQLDGGGREFLGASAERQDLLDGRNLVDLNALIVRRDVLLEVGGFDTTLRRWVDYDLVLRLLRRHELLYVPMIGVIYDHRASAGDRITTSQSPLWRSVVLEKNMIEWAALADAAGARAAGRISVLLHNRRQWSDTLATIRSLLRHAGGADVEIIVIDTASPREESAILTAAFLGDERVRVQRIAADMRRPAALNLALAASTGGQIVVEQAGALAASGWATASGTVTAAEFIARGGFTPMPEGDASGEALRWRDADSSPV